MSEVNEETAWPLRRAKAAATRLAVIDAASRVFVREGYAGASVQDIADAAGVSRATVFNAVGGKAALLKAAYDVATVGDDEPIPLPQRPEAIAARLEARPTTLDCDLRRDDRRHRRAPRPHLRGVPGCGRQRPRDRGLLEGDPGRAAEGSARLRRAAPPKGPLREGLDEDRAGDVVWALIDASLYHRLAVERGWTTAQFQEWLRATLESQLLRRPNADRS